MTKTELVKKTAEKTGVPIKTTAEVTNALFQVITEAMAAGDKISIIGFGSFEARNRSARKGRNPKTGEEIDIPAGKTPAFKAGKELKDAVAG